jgi:hypothetical protein
MSEFHDAVECQGCGESGDAVAGPVMVVGRSYPVPLCRECEDNLTFICPDCDRRIWTEQGIRVYSTANLYCGPCGRQHPAVAESIERDSFNEARR